VERAAEDRPRRVPRPRPTAASIEPRPAAPDSGEQRLDRFLARRGCASRRKVEDLIAERRVKVNGSLAEAPGQRIDPEHDVILVDGKPLRRRPDLVYLLVYKPKGVITGRADPDGRPSVLDLVPRMRVRLEPVGRLDFNTEGALLLTNDGDLAHRLTHPSTQVPRKYHVKVWKAPTEKTLERLLAGVRLEDGMTGPCKARVIKVTETGNTWIEITVNEGRNRLVRRIFETLGHPVAKLRRVSFATISIRGLDRGAWRALTHQEIRRLEDIAAGRSPRKAGHGPGARSTGA
jgi:pseudouridine synthase